MDAQRVHACARYTTGGVAWVDRGHTAASCKPRLCAVQGGCDGRRPPWRRQSKGAGIIDAGKRRILPNGVEESTGLGRRHGPLSYREASRGRPGGFRV